MNGDLFTALDFRELVAFHESSGATATVATLEREVPIEFGVIGVEGTRIVDYDEKPTIAYDVSMGVYVFEREVMDRDPRAASTSTSPTSCTSCSSGACRSPPTARRPSARHRAARGLRAGAGALDELRGELLPDEGQV